MGAAWTGGQAAIAHCLCLHRRPVPVATGATARTVTAVSATAATATGNATATATATAAAAVGESGSGSGSATDGSATATATAIGSATASGGTGTAIGSAIGTVTGTGTTGSEAAVANPERAVRAPLCRLRRRVSAAGTALTRRPLMEQPPAVAAALCATAKPRRVGPATATESGRTTRPSARLAETASVTAMATAFATATGGLLAQTRGCLLRPRRRRPLPWQAVPAPPPRLPRAVVSAGRL